MNADELLELETRRKIYNCILKYPGLHVSELSRKLDLPISTLIYHLKYLKKLGFIEETICKKYTRYYALKKIDRNHKKILNLVREEATRRVMIYLVTAPFASIDEISKHLRKHRKTVSYHLKKLSNADLLECFKINGEKKYILYEGKGRLLDVAIIYQDCFDEETNRFIKKVLHKIEKASDGCLAEKVIYDMFPHPYYG